MDEFKIVREIKVDSLDSFMSSIGFNGKLLKKLQSAYIYRGHSKSSYQLLPTALRKDLKKELWSLSGIGIPVDNQSEWEWWQIHVEYMLLLQFYRRCDSCGLYVPEVPRLRKCLNTDYSFDIEFLLKGEKWLPQDLYEIAGLAQHYGLLTRLLDWTSDFFTALYFASSGVICDKESNMDEAMVIWALNASYVDFLSSTTNRLPLRIIRPRYYGNPNLSAQRGLFTFWEIDKPYIEKEKPIEFLSGIKLVDRMPLDEQLNGACPKEKDYDGLLYKIIIPVKYAKDIYQYLMRIGYGASKHFPGYYGVVKNMKDDSNKV